ncbi:MAG: dihydrofolate reductase [Spirochaetes bacterium]|uniref:Dihydrofolate reductase n=1 Tax=Candidatus Ornithospirochaeta stercoripullorum TaxID=2840899 RepID=A0A9D9DZA1_9SPIO|nr:dihydrofolate reductase [Candidatus Ornithospirochaeta stercoripullorum]
MKKFRKLVEVGPIGLQPWAEEELSNYAETIIRFDTLPKDEDELVARIGDADAILVRTLPLVPASVLAKCKDLKYVGMCCSLYSKESANVDISYAEKHGITVYGIRDYGDKGVTEFVVYALIRILHGYDWPLWRKRPKEITGLKIGFVGFGTSGQMTARLLKAMGAEITYYARSRKEDCEREGMHYKALNELLSESEVVITCLNKGVILLHDEEFKVLGNGKIMINTSIGPAAEMPALKNWIMNDKNIFISDTSGGVGEIYQEIKDRKNVLCPDVSAGMTEEAYDLMSKKVMDNIKKMLSD